MEASASGANTPGPTSGANGGTGQKEANHGAQARRVAAPCRHQLPAAWAVRGGGRGGSGHANHSRRVFGLHRLRSFGRASPEDSARLCSPSCRRRSPTQRPRPAAGNGFITHVCPGADRAGGGAGLTSTSGRFCTRLPATRAGSYRDCIGLTLGLMGDRTVVPFLINYAADETNPPNLRERAIRALG